MCVCVCVRVSVTLSCQLTYRLDPSTDFYIWWLKRREFMQGCAFWGSWWWIITLGVQNPPKPPFWGLNSHFKPNMRNIQTAISLDLCIRLTWNLTGSCGQKQTSWVVSYGGKTIPRWRTAAILKIDISQYLNKKSADFDEILYTATDFDLDERHMIKYEKVALDRLWVWQNVFLVLYIKYAKVMISFIHQKVDIITK